MPNTSGLIELVSLSEGENTIDGGSPVDSGPAEQGGFPAGGGSLDSGFAEQAGAGGASVVDVGFSEQIGAGGASQVDIGNAEQGGVPPGGGQVDTDDVEAIMGNMLGKPADGSERPARGGLGVSVNGAGQSGERENINLDSTAFPGLTLAGSDNPPGERVDVPMRVDAEVEVYRQVIDLTQAPTTIPLFTPGGAQAGLIPTRLLLRATNVVGPVTTQPEIDLRRTALGDVIAQTALAFTGNDQCDELAASGVREFVPSGGTLTLGLGVSAAAGAYQVEVIALGRVVPT